MEKLTFFEDFIQSDLVLLNESENLDSADNSLATNSVENETKCGSIFLSQQETFIFVCEFCTKRFENMEQFGLHLRSRHFKSKDNDNAITESIEIQSLSEEDSLDCVPGSPKSTEDPNPNEPEAGTLKSFEIEVLNSVNVDDGEEEAKKEPLILKDPIKIVPSDFDELLLRCNICNYVFNTRSSFTLHKNRHLLVRVRGPDLKRKTLTRIRTVNAALKLEAERAKLPNDKQNDAKFHCNLCDLYFKRLYLFHKHSVIKHGNEIPQALQDDPTYLKCRFCHEQFDKPIVRATHEAEHDEKIRFKCTYCSKRFIKNSTRILHEHSHTGNQPFACPHCPKSFSSAINRLQHIRRHLNIHLNVCKFCDKSFVTSTELSTHERIHTKEKPFQCDECGKTFSVSNHLLYHKKRHANIRECECNVCGKSFNTNDTLKRHMVIHSDERPLECTICGKTFQRPSSLRTHRMLHDPEKRYECNICLKRFPQRAQLNSHKKVHGGEGAKQPVE